MYICRTQLKDQVFDKQPTFRFQVLVHLYIHAPAAPTRPAMSLEFTQKWVSECSNMALYLNISVTT